MSEEILLYDLACRGRCASWSFNAWKTRLVLNYKGLAYRTEWVDHVNVAEVLKATYETQFQPRRHSILIPLAEGSPRITPAKALLTQFQPFAF